jgi:hypothetical protein
MNLITLFRRAFWDSSEFATYAPSELSRLESLKEETRKKFVFAWQERYSKESIVRQMLFVERHDLIELKLRQISQSIREIESGVGDRSRIGALKDARLKWQNQHADLIARRSETATAPAKIFDRIFTVPRVVACEMDGTCLVVYTDTLYSCVVDQRKRRWYKIGRFRIAIDLVGRPNTPHNDERIGVQWHNLDRNQFSFSMCAPQIPRSGTVSCLGTTYSQIMRDAVVSGETNTLVAAAIRFAECPSKSRNMANWHRVSENKVPKWYLNAPLEW